ncbi:hypothetical protein J2046_006554 [Rhizobium petrolearium]|uniref:hypothetical protein n=1 Tax=Neorhizobium petrolearium TaxID=515361 RepID=UPI001AE4D112|nr:hypothetical protein [Neorhizobium petrolearium]MBP1848263.1 hypothetical protein [Neorhizobium petrolearium]
MPITIVTQVEIEPEWFDESKDYVTFSVRLAYDFTYGANDFDEVRKDDEAGALLTQLLKLSDRTSYCPYRVYNDADFLARGGLRIVNQGQDVWLRPDRSQEIITARSGRTSDGYRAWLDRRSPQACRELEGFGQSLPAGDEVMTTADHPHVVHLQQGAAAAAAHAPHESGIVALLRFHKRAFFSGPYDSQIILRNIIAKLKALFVRLGKYSPILDQGIEYLGRCWFNHLNDNRLDLWRCDLGDALRGCDEFRVLDRLQLKPDELEKLSCEILRAALIEATVILPFARDKDANDDRGPEEVYEAAIDVGAGGISIETFPRRRNSLFFETDLITPIGARSVYAARTHTPRAMTVDETSLLDVTTGYFRAPNGDPAVLARNKRLVERQAASQLWAMPAILTLDLLELPTAERFPINVMLRRLAWQFASAINASLDTVQLALFGTWRPNQPVVDGSNNRAGPLLGELVVRLESAIEDLPTSEFLDPTLLIRELRNVLYPSLSFGSALGEYATLVAELTGWNKKFAAGSAAFDETGILADFVQLAEFDSNFETHKLAFARKHLGLSADADTTQFNDLDTGLLAPLRDAAMVEIGELTDQLQSENGIERLLWSLILRVAGKPDPASETEKVRGAAELIAARLWAVPAPEQVEKIAEAVAGFKAVLDQSFNGAEATRQAASAVYAVNLMTLPFSIFSETSPEGALIRRLESSLFFSRRLMSISAQGSLDAVISALRPSKADPLSSAGDERKNIISALDAALVEIAGTFQSDMTGHRFVPDSAPIPLPITIAVDQDTSDLDDFANRFNGVGVVLCRSHWEGGHEKEDSWAYAGLAELKVAGGALESDWPTILPQRTAEVDGMRLLHVEYEGLPFAYSGFDALARPIDPIGDSLEPFVVADVPEPQIRNMEPWKYFARLPSLAYGSRFTVVGHVITKGGVLPYDLREKQERPWRPADTPFLTHEPDKKYKQTFDYFRRTAVGQTSIVEAVRGRERIGAAIDDVHPLIRDYPRVGTAVLSGPKNATSTFIDVFRDSGGRGIVQLPFDASEDAMIELADLAWWGDTGDFEIAVMSEASAGLTVDPVSIVFKHRVAGSFAEAQLRFDIIRFETAPGKWSYRFAPQFNGRAATAVEIPSEKIDASKRIWLRLHATSDGKSAITLADPARSSGRGINSRADGDALLMVADSDQGVWKRDISDPLRAKVTMPRVGFLDFMRWLNNPALRSASGISDALREQLLAIYTARHRDERLGKALERMPDPAVSKLRIEFTPLDGLAATLPQLAADKRPAADDVDVPSLGDISSTHRAAISKLQGKLHDEVADSYAKFLESLLVNYEFDLEVRSEGTQFSVRRNSTAVEVTIPHGMSGRLTIRPMVAEQLIDDPSSAGLAPFDARIVQLAVGKRDGHYLFEGAAIKVEAVLGEFVHAQPTEPWQNLPAAWRQLAAEVVQTRPIGSSRKYDLVASAAEIGTAAEGWKWRQVGSAELRTQRWNFSGRPVYNWIDPRKSAGKRGSGGSIRRIRFADDADRLHGFEAEAFFDRDDEDAERRSMVVSPLPADAVLQTFEWEKPSATMFRHRLILRSRYAGAMNPWAHRAVNCWISADEEARNGADDTPESWIRAVVLGDRDHIGLSRPPLRALIPLTQPVDQVTGAHGKAPPPILAIMEERPFNYGGLADRVSFEVSTGVGYGFPTTQSKDKRRPAPEEKVEPRDIRREIGPDGRLDYYPLDEGDARGMILVAEGPVGLTFDQASAPKPAFPNSAVVLHPFNMLRADGTMPGGLEEHFLALATRRYLDHRWLASEEERTEPHSAGAAWWIELPTVEAIELIHSQRDPKSSYPPRNVLRIAGDGRKWSVAAYRKAIDPTVALDKDPLLLSGALKVHAAKLAILHLPLEPGRFSLSVFAVPDGYADVSRGLNNLPAMLASIDWSPGLGVPTGDLKLILPKGSGEAAWYRVGASPSTARTWTRTGRDFTVIAARTASGEMTAFAADQIAVDFTDDGTPLRFVERGSASPIWLRPVKSAESEAPLNVHRHLTALFTKILEGPGRTIERYAGARTILGNTIDLPPLAKGGADLRVRIVEIETPAAIVYCAPVTAAEVYQLRQLATGYFDREAIGKGGDLSDLSFFVRFAATASQREKITTAEISLALPGSEEEASGKHDLRDLTPDKSGPINCSKIRSNVPIRGLLIALRTDGRKLSWHYRTLHDDGTLSKEFDLPDPTSVTAQNAKRSPGLLLAVEVQGVGGEIWADVSMLSGSHLEFDFDWLFSSDQTDASVALRPESMTMAPEAEARIIAVSPPVPLRSDGARGHRSDGDRIRREKALETAEEL